jgi:hypothetical protein
MMFNFFDFFFDFNFRDFFFLYYFFFELFILYRLNLIGCFFFFCLVFFNNFFFSVIHDWQVISYYCDHSIIIFLGFYIFFFYSLRMDCFISFKALFFIFLFGLIFGGQWAIYSDRWGFFWYRDIIEIFQIVFLLLVVYFFHYKYIYCVSYNMFWFVFSLLYILLILWAGFFLSNHNTFQIFKFNNNYLYLYIYCCVLIVFFFFLNLISFFFFFKLILFFIFFYHCLFFWICIIFFKFNFFNRIVLYFFLNYYIWDYGFFFSKKNSFFFLYLYNFYIYKNYINIFFINLYINCCNFCVLFI